MSGYTLIDFDDLLPEEAQRVRDDIMEAERGYSIEELKAAVLKHRGRPLKVGSTPADATIRVRLDAERKAKLTSYMERHNLSQSDAVRALLDKALVDA